MTPIFISTSIFIWLSALLSSAAYSFMHTHSRFMLVVFDCCWKSSMQFDIFLRWHSSDVQHGTCNHFDLTLNLSMYSQCIELFSCVAFSEFCANTTLDRILRSKRVLVLNFSSDMCAKSALYNVNTMLSPTDSFYWPVIKHPYRVTWTYYIDDCCKR